MEELIEETTEPRAIDRASPDPDYGDWKAVEDLELEDFLKHPIWHWCIQIGMEGEEDCPIGGDESAMRPWLAGNDLAEDSAQGPVILMRLEGTDQRVMALYDAEQGKATILRPLEKDSLLPAAAPMEPIYIAVPTLAGKAEVRFKAKEKGSDEVFREDVA